MRIYEALPVQYKLFRVDQVIEGKETTTISHCYAGFPQSEAVVEWWVRQLCKKTYVLLLSRLDRKG